MYSCKLCSKVFGSTGGCKRHMESVHFGVRYECPDCKKQMTGLGKLKRHIKTLHQKASDEKSELKGENCTVVIGSGQRMTISEYKKLNIRNSIQIS